MPSLVGSEMCIRDRPNKKQPSGDESLLGGADLTAAPSPSPGKPAANSGGDLLAGGNDDLTAATPTPKPSSSSGKSDDLTSGDLLDAAPAGSPSPSAAPPPTPFAKPAEEWVAAGGWYRPPDSFSLFYRPVGHSDPFLVAWLNAAARLQAEIATGAPHDAFKKLADPQTPGLCMKCHTVEKSEGITLVNWLPAQPNTKSRPFTTFSHTTHFSLVGDAGCQTCHAPNPKSQYAKFFSSEPGTDLVHNAIKFQSNFAPMSRMLCVKCHQRRIAGDACILCHRYHAAPVAGELAGVGRFRPSLGKKLAPDGELRSQDRN